MTEVNRIEHEAGLAGEAGFESVMSVGSLLRVARESRQLSLEDVALTLKLGARQVEALENGDWHALPGQTFIRGFVRNYARLLQIDSTPLMERLDETLEKPVDSLHVPPSRPTAMPSSHPRRDRTVVAAGLALVVAALLAYAFLAGDIGALRERTQSLLDSFARKEAPASEAALGAAAPVNEPAFPPGSTPQQVMNPQAQPSAELVPAPLNLPAAGQSTATIAAPGAATQAAAAPSAPPVVSAQTALRFVFSGESWVEVRDRDDKVVFSQRNVAGSEQGVGGQGPFSLVIGNAGAVRLFWRGQAIDLAPHTRGDVARLVLE